MREGIPELFSSERLDIRCPDPSHAAELHTAIEESLNEIQPWMPWATGDQTIEGCADNLREAQQAYRTGKDLRLNLFLRGSGTFVGGSGLHRINWDVPRFEIGYWVRTSLACRGLITEAVERIARFAFEDLEANRVEIRMSSRNTRSRRVAERAGFAIDTILRKEGRHVDGSLRDTCVYSRISADS